MTTQEATLGVDPAPGASFRGALASRDFSFLFVGQLGSEIGNGAVQLALPLLVLDLTNSPFQLGLAYFFQFLPILLFGLVGGVFVDRWDRRRTIVVVDAIRAVAFMSVAVIYYLDTLTATHLFAVIFIEASLANLFNPARAALMPNLVDSENLRPANSLIEVSRHIGFVIAPLAGGAVSSLLGPASIMLFDGVTFFVSAVTVFLIRWRAPRREAVQSENFAHSLRMVGSQSLDGFKALLKSRLLQVTVLLGFGLNLVVAPIQVLLPLFVRYVKHEGASYFTFLVLGLLVGLILGSLLAPAIARRFGLGRMTIAAVFILGGVICVASLPPTLWPPFFAMLAAGMAIGSLNVAQATMLQSATSDHDRGRVSATYYTATYGIRPIGFLAVGALASAVDIRIMFVGLGLATLCLGAYLSQRREVRDHH
ncbi:MAG TPA: MFS transporter [Dehalococcoidia bacterium]|nr:MFS transporter [Dehalococcoidia bacterium]